VPALYVILRNQYTCALPVHLEYDGCLSRMHLIYITSSGAVERTSRFPAGIAVYECHQPYRYLLYKDHSAYLGKPSRTAANGFVFSRNIFITICIRIRSTKSPLFCMKTFSTSLTKLTVLLPQSRDCSCYLNRKSTGTFTDRTVETHLSMHLKLRELSSPVTST
jgi:hypothetical protein